MMPPSQPITNKKEFSSVLVEGVLPRLVSIVCSGFDLLKCDWIKFGATFSTNHKLKKIQ